MNEKSQIVKKISRLALYELQLFVYRQELRRIATELLYEL